MKIYGIVTEYNRLYGNIKGEDGVDYVLLDKNLVDPNVDVLDYVEFESEVYQTPEVEVPMAMFVKSLTKKQESQKKPK